MIICGKEPKSCAGLKADDRAFASIVDDIWHSRRKNVFAKGLEDCLRRSGIQPDFRATVTSPVAEPVVRHSSPTIKATGGSAGHFDKLSDRNMSLSDQEKLSRRRRTLRTVTETLNMSTEPYRTAHRSTG